MAQRAIADRRGEDGIRTSHRSQSNKSDSPSNSNFPLGPGAGDRPNAASSRRLDSGVITYIAFAYKLMANDIQSLLSELPPWAATDRFGIQARAHGDPSKDQMRLMMRALLQDRFKLSVHNETREVPALALLQQLPA